EWAMARAAVLGGEGIGERVVLGAYGNDADIFDGRNCARVKGAEKCGAQNANLQHRLFPVQARGARLNRLSSLCGSGTMKISLGKSVARRLPGAAALIAG